MKAITLYNRAKKVLEKEIVFGEALMHFMYENKFGITLTEKILKKKAFSVFYGNLLKKASSKNKILPFIKQHNIKVEEILDPIESFSCFNDFFIRKLKPNARPIDFDKDALISPADSRLIVYKLEKDTIIPVKGLNFTLYELTMDQEISKKYENGYCLVFRLAPADYHRFCYLDNGYHKEIKIIGDYFHSVNPIALESNKPIFQGNYREMCELFTENFGEVLSIEVGALGVSKIVQNHPLGTTFKRGDEKGYFEFGGSTVIMIFKENTIKIADDILDYSKIGIESLITYGSTIGSKAL